MRVVQTQITPIPTYEIKLEQGDSPNDLIDWLKDQSLPADLNVSCRGRHFRFYTVEERRCFAMGIDFNDFSWDVLGEKP